MMPILILFFITTSLLYEVNSKCNRAYEHDTYFWLCRNISSLKEVKDYGYDPVMRIIKMGFRKVQITSSVVPTIPPSSFDGFRLLPKLELTGIGIKNISAGAFPNMNNLRSLDINSNSLDRIDDGVFNSMPLLEVLDLSNNHIESISRAAFAGLNELRNLNLSTNRLKNFDSDLSSNLPKLSTIDVSRNPLEKIYLEQSCKNFKIDLTETLLTQENFHSKVESFLSLKWTHSQLSKINISTLPFVTKLDLSQNKIGYIENLAKLQSITITLHHNGLTVINERLFGSQNISKTTQLSFLDFSFNNIREIKKSAFQNLTSLEDLSLNNNHISEIDPILFKNLEKLKFLNLSRNNIERFLFGTFDSLSNLKILDISQNRLINLHEHTYHALEGLEKLYFHNNHISFIDIENWNLHHKKLEVISLNGNNISCQNIVKIAKCVNISHVARIKSENFDSDNYHGISCVNDKNFGSNSHSKLLKKIIMNTVNKSALAQFVNFDFKKSNFRQFFEIDHTRRNSLPIAENSRAADFILILNSVILIVVTVLILIVLVNMFMYVKKNLILRNIFVSSHMELR